MASDQQSQIHGVEGQVAAEREQPHLGVAVDVPLADLDEPAAEGQQFQPGPLRRTGQRVQHDVDAVAVGVACGSARRSRCCASRRRARCPCRATASRRSAAAGGSVDLRAGGPGDRDGGLTDAAGGGVDQHLVARPDPGQVVQRIPRRGMGAGHGGGGGVGQLGRDAHRQVGITGDERAPRPRRRDAGDTVADLVIGDPGAHGGHHAGEVRPELGQPPLEGRVPAVGHQDVGEVEVGAPTPPPRSDRVPVGSVRRQRVPRTAGRPACGSAAACRRGRAAPRWCAAPRPAAG